MDLNCFIILIIKYKNSYDCKLMFKIMFYVYEIWFDFYLIFVVKILKCNYFLECDVIF